MGLLDEFFAELALHQPWPGRTLALALRETLVRGDHRRVALRGFVGDGLFLLRSGNGSCPGLGEDEADARDYTSLAYRLPVKAERGMLEDVLVGLFQHPPSKGGEVGPVGFGHIELFVQVLDWQRDLRMGGLP